LQSCTIKKIPACLYKICFYIKKKNCIFASVFGVRFVCQRVQSVISFFIQTTVFMRFSYVFSLRSLMLLCGAAVLIGLLSCNAPTNSPPSPGDLTPKLVNDLRPDSAARFLYFSFDTDGVVPATMATSDKWDIRLPYLSASSRSIDIVLNSGNINTNGKTRGLMIDTTFDLLQSAPEETRLRTEDTSVVSGRRNTIVPGDLLGTGLFLYNGATRTLSINPQRTLVLTTAGGKFVKVQFVNLYQGAVATPTMFTPVGYYTIRYVKSNTRQLR
jgi:hypothetical protein